MAAAWWQQLRKSLAAATLIFPTVSGGSEEKFMDAPTCTELLGPRAYTKELLNPSIYDNGIRPGLNSKNGDSGPTKVEVQLHVYALNEVNQKKGEITMSAYLRTWWKDPRLAYNDTSVGGCYLAPIILPKKDEDSVWTPNLYIPNLVDAAYMKDLTYIYSDGRVWQSKQVLLTTHCKLTFHRMPFDHHNCEITLASYSLGIDSVRVVARGQEIGTPEGGEGLVGEGVTSVMWKMLDGPDFHAPGEVDVNGGWDYLNLKYTLKRLPKFFILQYLVPDFLFLLLVYVGFFVNPNAAPARAALAIIPVLILRTLSNSVYTAIPQISTNVWLCDYLLASMGLCCMVTVQFGLVEFALIQEKPGVDRAAALKAKKDVINKCLKEAKVNDVSVRELLDIQEEELKEAAATHGRKKTHVAQGVKVAVEVPPREFSKTLSEMEAEAGIIFEGDSEGGYVSPPRSPRVLFRSTSNAHAANQKKLHTLTEADLTLVMYACNLFQVYDNMNVGDGNNIGPRRMSRALRRFNLFYDARKTAKLMTLFLADRGVTVMDPSLSAPELKFEVDLFLDFLNSVNDYLLAIPPPRQLNPFSRSLPASVTWDILFRWFFPLAVAVKMLIFFTMVSTYPENGPLFSY